MTYGDVLLRLQRSFNKFPGSEVRAVLLVFGKPHCKLFREEIAPDLAYLDYSSAEHLDIFCFGFPDAVGRRADASPVLEHGYSPKAFVDAVREFQERTTWTYSNETDLILLAGVRTEDGGATLDFEHAWTIHLEEAVKTGLIHSASTFIQRAINIAQSADPRSFASSISGTTLCRTVRQSVIAWICKALHLDPKDADRVAATLVRDIRRRK
jgi:hypothetical protein